jgi:hypothetical protein
MFLERVSEVVFMAEADLTGMVDCLPNSSRLIS